MALNITSELEEKIRQAAAATNQSVEAYLSDLIDAQATSDAVSPSQLHRLLELAPANAAIVRFDGTLVYVNNNYANTFQRSREELTTMNFFDLVDPADLASTRTAHNNLIESGQLVRFVNRNRTPDGQERVLEWTAAASQEEQLIFAISRDATLEHQLERNLFERAEQITRILESVTDAFFSLDRNWNILYLNSHAEDLLDRPADELIGKSIWDEFGDAVKSTFYEQYHTAMQEQVTVSFTEYYEPLQTWFEVRAYPAPDFLSVYFRDVNREKLLEEQLRADGALLNGIVNSQIDLVSRYKPDTTLTFVNDAYCNFFGQPRESLLGTRFINHPYVKGGAMVRARLDEVMRDPSPAVRILPHIDKSAANKWIQWLDFGICDQSGEVVEIQAVGRDITPLYEARAETEAQKEMLQTVIDRIPVMILVSRLEGETLFGSELVNRYWVEKLGWTIEEMQAQPDIMTAFYPDPAYRTEVAEYMRSAVPGWREFETVAKDGSIVVAEWANVELSDGRLIGIGHDLADRKQLEIEQRNAQALEEELRQERELTELKNRFVSTVSHEFRTPLTVIVTSVELMINYFDRMEKARILTRLSGIEGQVNHMVALLDDVLALSRAGSPNIQLQYTQIAIAPFVVALLDTARIIDTGNHHFKVDTEEANRFIRADRRLLQHAFANLLTNAIKYSPAESQIDVIARIDGETFKFIVEDRGMGIPDADLDSLFDAFHRATNAQQFPGTGLGLAIVKQYIDLHGGEIFIDSKLAEGTRIEIHLPVDGNDQDSDTSPMSEPG